jgi:carbonic anhydrase
MHSDDSCRRRFLKSAGLALLAGGTMPVLSIPGRPAQADVPAPDIPTQASRAAKTPEDALQALKEGNARFAEGRLRRRDYRARIKATATAQFPFAAIVGCMDSRASNELIFDQGIGDLFSLRVAGNYIDDGILGGLEFACAVSGAKLIAVVGHTECGAIKGACDHVVLGNLTRALAKLAPAIDAVPGYTQDRTSSNRGFVNAVTTQNVMLGVERIRARSPILRDLHDKGSIALTGAVYDVHTGIATFLPV